MVASRNSQEQRDLLIRVGAAAGPELCARLDEWDYWAEGSFNLGIYMWTI